MRKNHLYTVGHSNHKLNDFLLLLQDNEINLLIDVRSSPYSKFVTHFNKENLRSVLKINGIDYLYLGNKIGGKPKNQKYYNDGKIDYDLLSKDRLYQDGIKELINLLKNENLAIMCSEENPRKCHRHMLITQTLLKNGINVTHIRGNCTTEQIEKREKKEIQTTLF